MTREVNNMVKDDLKIIKIFVFSQTDQKAPAVPAKMPVIA